jgi:hypothetical protein
MRVKASHTTIDVGTRVSRELMHPVATRMHRDPTQSSVRRRGGIRPILVTLTRQFVGYWGLLLSTMSETSRSLRGRISRWDSRHTDTRTMQTQMRRRVGLHPIDYIRVINSKKLSQIRGIIEFWCPKLCNSQTAETIETLEMVRAAISGKGDVTPALCANKIRGATPVRPSAANPTPTEGVAKKLKIKGTANKTPSTSSFPKV